jgi:hypothetical protein
MKKGTGNDFETLQKKFVVGYLDEISKKREVVKQFEIALKNVKSHLMVSMTGLDQVVEKIFKETPLKGSPLKKFLSSKLPVPHQDETNCLSAITNIIVRVLTNPYRHGKTTRGGAEQIGFVGSQKGLETWAAIEVDLKKICNEFFGITPFLDCQKKEFPQIGFYVNSKWEEKDGVIVEIQK